MEGVYSHRNKGMEEFYISLHVKSVYREGFVFIHARSWLPQAQSLVSKVFAHTKLSRSFAVCLVWVFFLIRAKLRLI